MQVVGDMLRDQGQRVLPHSPGVADPVARRRRSGASRPRQRSSSSIPPCPVAEVPWKFAWALVVSAAYEGPALFDARLARRDDGSAAVRLQGRQLQADRPPAGRLVGGA